MDPSVQPERLSAVFGAAWPRQLVLPLILPLELVIQNQGTQPLRLSQADIALELPDGSQSRPLPLAAVARWFAASHAAVVPKDRATPPEEIRPNQAAWQAAWLAMLGVGALIAERHTRYNAEAEQAAAYRSKELQEVVLAQGESASGFVFFPSPAERGFREATLLLRFVDVTATPAVVIRLPLHGLGGGGRSGIQ